MKTIFLDTNIFMHCDPPDQIPWLEVFEADRVEIIVPMIVVDELDRHKDNHPQIKLRRRALERLKQLEKWSLSEHEEIRRGVSIVLETWVPTVDFEALRLKEAKPDHLLIASMVAYRDEHGETDIVLVAHDTGPRLTARRLKFEAVELPKDCRIEGEPDPLEKDNRELKQKLQRFENAHPNLSLAFFAESNLPINTEIVLRKILPITESSLDKEMTVMRNRYPFVSYEQRKAYTWPQDNPHVVKLLEESVGQREKPSFIDLHRQLTDRDIDTYNNSVDVFLTYYEHFYRYLHDILGKYGRTAILDLALVNSGTKPGEDINIHLSFPVGLSLYQNYPHNGIPRPPIAVAPLKERVSLDTWSSEMLGNELVTWVRPLQPSFSFDQENVRKLDVDPASFEKSKGCTITLNVNRIKHGVPENLPRFYLVFGSESASNFTINYELKAANVPDSVSGKLHVAVTTQVAAPI